MERLQTLSHHEFEMGSPRGWGNRFNSLRKRVQLGCAAVGCLVSFLISSSPMAEAQIEPRVRADGIGVVVIDERSPQELDRQREQNRAKYGGGATLRTDSELEELLRRAKQFADQSSFRNATLLWQRVLESSNDSLVSRDGETYFSLTMEVERTIAGLDREGLRQYRVTADGEARALMAQAESREDGLNDVFNRFFLSSFGDDAAYELGCLALDRYDFLTAQRVFRKILESYPDPTVSLNQCRLRLAVASAHLGDREGAKQLLGEIDDSDSFGQGLLAMVEADVESAENQLLNLGTQDSKQWLMGMGQPDRRGAMPAPAIEPGLESMAVIWEFKFPTNFKDIAVYSSPLDGTNAEKDAEVEPETANPLLTNWKANSWYPKSHVLVRDGQVYFRTNNDIVCWDLAERSDQPKWRSLWLNAYQQDAGSQQLAMMRQAYNQGNSTGQPSTPFEVMLFGDQVHQQMSLIDDCLYAIEGRRFSRYGGKPPIQPQQQVNRGFQNGMSARRARTNWLTAYDAENGKLKWHIAPRLPLDRFGSGITEAENAETESGLGFMSSPVPYGQYLILPVSDGGSIWLQALDHRTGEAVWTTYLCDEPTGGASFWSPITLAVEGRELYAICGSGVLFALDASTGAVRFARRYERNGKQSTLGQQFGNVSTTLIPKGWDGDQLLPFGNVLVILASDHDRLFAVDRQTGEFKWNAPRELFNDSMRYCMGFANNRIYCAGKRSVTCYDLAAEGLVRWSERLPEVSYGKGMVTSEGVFIPTGNKILHLDLTTGDVINEFLVRSNGEEPVGNLYSDGNQIWTAGLSRVSVLGSLQQQFELLTKGVEQGDLNSLLERSTLQFELSKTSAAFEDVRAFYQERFDADSAESGTRRIFRHFEKQAEDSLRPEEFLAFIVSLGVAEQASEEFPTPLSTTALNEFSGFVVEAINKVGMESTPEANKLLMKMLGMVDSGFISNAILVILNDRLDELNPESLFEIGKTSSPEAKQIVASMLAKLGDDRSLQLVDSLLETNDPKYELVRTRVLANLGDPSATGEFVKLMGAESVPIRAQAWADLQQLLGQEIDFNPLADADLRTEQLKNLQAKLEEGNEPLEFKLPLGEAQPFFGHLLIVTENGSRVVELDRDRQEVWSANYENIRDAEGLPNGNRLIVISNGRRVIEVDREGKEVFALTDFPAPPSSATRLPNGNTLVTCSEPAARLIEFDADGKKIWEINPGPFPSDAIRLPNGNTMVALRGADRVLELDANGTPARTIPLMDDVRSVEQLPNGNTLVALGTLAEVREIAKNQNNDEVWQSKKLGQEVTRATRLPNGNVLVATGQGVFEIEPSTEKVIWKQADGTPAASVDAF